MKRGRLSVAWACGVILVGQTAWAQSFSVRRAADDEVVLEGELSQEALDPATTLPVQQADFSELKEPGEYYIDVPDVGRSVAFRIGADVYDGELANIMLGFYGWRSGVDVSFERHGLKYEQPAGHLSDGLLDYVDGQVGESRDGTGGWYDAGDYGKYLPTASESLGSMLAAWELYSDRLKFLSLPFLPEHGSELPDYLSELKWELDWLFKMQYADGSGRVHHKLNSPNFPGFIMPAQDNSKRYFSEYSTAATAELVATFAKAARVFAPYDDVTDGYSQKLLEAAQLSWAYLLENPEDHQYDASVLKAGTYQKNDIGDRMWAAAELWETTGDADALAEYERRQSPTENVPPNFDWDNLRPFGVITYALSKREGRDPAKLERARKSLLEASEEIVSDHAKSGYGRAYPGFYWGSNGVIARTCMLLQTANQLEPDPRFVDACAAQIGHIYGRNQYNRSYVTGSGIAPPLEPHHRPSGADTVKEPYPGLLIGGGQSPTNWKDKQSDYTSNEVAINWNAALVYALAGFIQGEGAEASLGQPPVAAEDCGVRVSSVGFVPSQSKVATVQKQCELEAPFMCVQPESTLSGDTSGPLVSIDDFEDGDTAITLSDGRQGDWVGYDDGTAGTRTQPTITAGGANGSQSALCIQGSGFSDWGGGMSFTFKTPRAAYDASKYSGISFWARGKGARFSAQLTDKFSDPNGNLCAGCYDHYQAPFTPGAEWQKYSFAFSALQQQGFGDEQPSVCAAEVYALQFQWPRGVDFELCLDDVAFTTVAGTSPEQPGGGEPEPTPTDSGQLGASGGGCGCRAAGAGAGWGGSLLLLGAAASFARRRRRAPRSA